MEKMKTVFSENINTKSYWETRFSTGDWEKKGGRSQTASFAEAQVSRINLPRDFSGLLVDFGCGLGDAMPIYKHHFTNVKLMGIDVSEGAVSKCREKYGHIADFMHGTHEDVPEADVIVASNVFEHLSDDIHIARVLLKKCHDLYIVVPYKEWPLCKEHVRTYDEKYFFDLSVAEYTIFPSRNWSEYGLQLFRLMAKNLFLRMLGRSAYPRRMQIMFHLQGRLLNEN